MKPTTVVNALLESLPHVQAWAGRTVVVKIGGAAMTDAALVAGVTEDAVLLGANLHLRRLGRSFVWPFAFGTVVV